MHLVYLSDIEQLKRIQLWIWLGVEAIMLIQKIEGGEAKSTQTIKVPTSIHFLLIIRVEVSPMKTGRPIMPCATS